MSGAWPGRPIRILELRSVRGTGGGPEKTILLGTARTDRTRFDITVCYVRDARDDVFRIDTWAESLGVSYVEITERTSFDWRIWPQLRALVRERGIDIVHAHDYKTDLLAYLAARVDGVIPLSTAHGFAGHSARELRVYYPADRWLLARFPRVIAVSGEIRRMLIAAGARPERVTTIANGIDAAQFVRDRAREPEARAALGLPADAVVIGSVGRLGVEKRFDLLIEAFGRLARTDPRVHLAIAGDGDLRADLQGRLDALGLGTRARLLGQRGDVAFVHHALDVFVLSSDHEGAPNAVLEAMALETPLVATAVGAVPEMAPHGTHALLVPPGDADALTAALAQVLADPAAAVGRAATARRQVETTLSFGHRMTQVEQVYVDLMAAGHGGGGR